MEVGVEDGVPEGTLVGVVGQGADAGDVKVGDRVVVGAVYGVVGMGTISAVSNGAEAGFFDSVVGEGFTEGVLGEPHLGWAFVLEAHHCMLPVLERLV